MKLTLPTLCAIFWFQGGSTPDRADNRDFDRLSWKDHTDFLHRREFYARYKMDVESFEVLCGLVALARNRRVGDSKASRRAYREYERCGDFNRKRKRGSGRNGGRPADIPVPLRVAATLRYLGGGTPTVDSVDMHGISPGSVSRVIDETILDITVGLDNMRFEPGVQDFTREEREFSARTSIFSRIVGALDGIAIRIRRPTNAECENRAKDDLQAAGPPWMRPSRSTYTRSILGHAVMRDGH